MSKPKRYLAFLAYLLPIFGWLYVLLFHKKEKFAVYHAKQSMMLTITAIGAQAVWAVIAWVVSWVPFIGPVIAVALFSLVIATYMLLAVVWITGMIYALQAKARPIPVVGGWAQWIQERLASADDSDKQKG
ncbi:MAG: hypothetical protein KAW49_10470 [Anaerolineae bacterium]|nr:hypothetical protein [Anaerolineae bacterium]